MATHTAEVSDLQVIGQRHLKPDAWLKATGEAIYAGDVRIANALQGKILRSPHPHARIVSIDTSAAEAMPGVYAIVTGRDIPPTRIGRFIRDRHALAREKVIYVGEPVAAVAAVDDETAERAVELIRVDYEPLPAVFDAAEALQPDAPIIHPEIESYEDNARTVRAGNMRNHVTYERGDVDAAFEEPGVVVWEATYRTPRQSHAFTEPHAAVAQMDATSKITIWASNKVPFRARLSVADTLGVPLSRVRMVSPVIGGDFGGKGAPFIEPIVALLARKARRPVRIVLTRVEEFLAMTSRPSGVIRLKMGVRRDGTIVALDGTLLFNVGAVDDNGAGLATSATSLIGGYRVPNVRLDSTSAYTNTSPSGHVRSPSGMPTSFPSESHIDTLARMIGMDPLELRKKNALVEGDTAPSGRGILHNVGLQECIERAQSWVERELGPCGPNEGVGFALSHLALRPNPPETESAATVRIDVDGSVTVSSGVTDQGGGQWSTVAEIAAEVLGVPADQVTVVAGDTESTPFERGTGASETTYRVGNIVRQAAENARERLLEVAAEQLGVDEEEIKLAGSRAFVAADRARGIPLAEVARKALTSPEGAIIGVSGERADASATEDRSTWVDAPSFACHVAKVRVDPESGLVDVLRYFVAQDVGRALNTLHCEGQIQGGVVFGLGFALTEEIISEQGTNINANLWEYLLPTAPHIPEITVEMVQVPSTFGPFGAKGVGETSNVSVAAAIANAVEAALGVRVYEAPLTPERILQAARRAQ